MRSIKQIMINTKPKPGLVSTCVEPSYTGNRSSPKVLMGCGLMKTHSTSEGWQMQLGLKEAGYTMAGGGLEYDSVDTRKIISELDPGVVVVQDKREWDGRTAGYGLKDATWMRFIHVGELKRRTDIFKLTVLKDSHSSLNYHKLSGEEIGTHGWIIYYDPALVKHLSMFVREEHCVQTTHCVDKNEIPEFLSSELRFGSILSGAIYRFAYPLRSALVREQMSIPGMVHLPHPGYGHEKCDTPEYLETLSKYKVSICTSSIYGFLLRKLIESTCCGCMVVTDLPFDTQPHIIEENLTRVSTVAEVKIAIREMYHTYDNEKQRDLAQRASEYYDYRAVGKRLTIDIERMRQNYG